MKVLVVGTWNTQKSQKYSLQAQELGLELAKRKHVLVASPSSGFQGLVAEAYKKNGGSEFIGYYPELKLMKEVGEEVLIQPDTPIYTGQDYPIRNILQVRDSDAVIGITGGAGTLTELIASINDYELPTAFYQGSSPVVSGFRDIEPYFAKRLEYGNDIGKLLDYLESPSTRDS